MTTYQPAPETIIQQAKRIIEKYHVRLIDAGVRIDYLMAHASVDEKTGEPVGPAIRGGGVPAWGYCRIINLRDRAKGMGDVEIALDGDHWNNIDQEQQDAIIDHELTHIKIADGKVDDLGRPKIRMRDHDYDVGWFVEVAARHGAHSIEVKQAREIKDESPILFQPELQLVKEVAA